MGFPSLKRPRRTFLEFNGCPSRTLLEVAHFLEFRLKDPNHSSPGFSPRGYTHLGMDLGVLMDFGDVGDAGNPDGFVKRVTGATHGLVGSWPRTGPRFIARGGTPAPGPDVDAHASRPIWRGNREQDRIQGRSTAPGLCTQAPFGAKRRNQVTGNNEGSRPGPRNDEFVKTQLQDGRFG
jgi:hypothetical protein